MNALDKLSILKLIGNFLSNNALNSKQTPTNTSENTNTNTPLSVLENLIKPNSDTPIKEQVELKSAPQPLQKELLSAMTSHDEFLKRVNKNNLK